MWSYNFVFWPCLLPTCLNLEDEREMPGNLIFLVVIFLEMYYWSELAILCLAFSGDFISPVHIATIHSCFRRVKAPKLDSECLCIGKVEDGDFGV